MIKNFDYVVNGTSMHFCVTLAEGTQGHRAIITRAEDPRTLVMIDVGGFIEKIKSEIESPEAFLDDAVKRAQKDGLIERALATGEIQTGAL
jgi:hypothetical protein